MWCGACQKPSLRLLTGGREITHDGFHRFPIGWSSVSAADHEPVSKLALYAPPLCFRSSLSVRRSPRAHFRRRTSSHRQEILHKLGFPVVHAGRGQQQHRGHQWSDPPTPRGGQSRAVGSRRARQTSVLNAQLVKNSKYSELSILDLFFQEIEGQFCAIDIFLLWLRQRPHPSMYFAID